MDISGEVFGVMRWPGKPWIFAWGEEALRGFNLESSKLLDLVFRLDRLWKQPCGPAGALKENTCRAAA